MGLVDASVQLFEGVGWQVAVECVPCCVIISVLIANHFLSDIANQTLLVCNAQATNLCEQTAVHQFLAHAVCH